jgi:hypothetical protein
VANVDPHRIYFMGRSNGGIMSYRMACDHSEKIAAVFSLSGPMYFPENADDNPANGEDYCRPTQPVHVAYFHGTSDPIFPYGGGAINFPGHPLNGSPVPGAQDGLNAWSALNLCSTSPGSVLGIFDFDLEVGSAETRITRYPSGCHYGGSTELWRGQGSDHNPAVTDAFRDQVFAYFDSHPKQKISFQDNATIDLPSVVNAESYVWYRGDLVDLVDADADGQPDDGFGTCVTALDVDPTDGTFEDTETPAPGEGYFYVTAYVDDLPSTGGRMEGGIGKTGVGAHRQKLTVCP